MQLNWSLFEWPLAGLLVVAAAVVVIGKLGQWEAVLLAWWGSSSPGMRHTGMRERCSGRATCLPSYRRSF
jgi:hypothetical protein